MLNSIKVGSFIMERRKKLGMTQQQLADRLNISFQAVSKWETGAAFPNIEILHDLAIALSVTADEILAGKEKEADGLSYSKAGIEKSGTCAEIRGTRLQTETCDGVWLYGVHMS